MISQQGRKSPKRGDTFRWEKNATEKQSTDTAYSRPEKQRQLLHKKKGEKT